VVNEKEEQLLVEPKAGSYVLVIDLSGEYRDLAIIGYSEVAAIHIKIGDTTGDMDKDGIIFNNGTLNGLVKVGAMVDWMSKLYSDLQTLKTQLSTHLVAGNGAPLALVFNPTVDNPQIANFENSKVKQ
jgi:hypothetical protein